jgi:hypothetical protein
MTNYAKYLLERHKIKKIEKKINEMRDDAKKIISGIMSELVKYDIGFVYSRGDTSKVFIYGITCGKVNQSLDLMVYSDNIKIKFGETTIATYENASLWQKLNHDRNLKRFIYTEDAIRAISNMIIMREVI